MFQKLLAMAFLLCCGAAVAAQQPGVTTRYIYDQNGRLRAVITPEGAAVYEYDAAGNFTAIRRLGPGACEILEFTPRQGPVGTEVTIYGIGFNGQVAAVTINGASAQIVRQTAVSAVVAVPPGAANGPLTVTLPCGAKTFTTPFTLSGVRVTPSAITLLPGRNARFTAEVAGVVEPGVIWSVNGLTGGNDTIGRVDENGNYTLPPAVSDARFIIRATSVSDPALFGEATVSVAGEKSGEVPAVGVSVRFGPPAPNNNDFSFFFTSVSVRLGPYIDDTGKASAFIAGGPVSARYGPPPPNNNEPAQFVSSAVSARLGPQAAVEPADDAAAQDPPVIFSVTTVRHSSKQTLLLTVRGENLSDVVAVRFFSASGSPEPGLTAITAEPGSEGTRLKLEVALSEGSPVRQPFIQVITRTGRTPPRASRANTLDFVR